jgi:hypothetical protein
VGSPESSRVAKSFGDWRRIVFGSYLCITYVSGVFYRSCLVVVVQRAGDVS